MRLTDQELHEVLVRAEEIQHSVGSGDDARAEMEAVVAAGEAVGLTRPAIERAIRERFDLDSKPPAAGELAFARSMDGRYYVARVLALSADEARVRFLRGGELTLVPSQLRPCTFLPGSRVTCEWPAWGQWTATVVNYNAESMSVTLNDGWGSTHVASLGEVWLKQPKRDSDERRWITRATLIGAGAAAGGAIGTILTLLLSR